MDENIFICQACLSRERLLFPLNKLYNILMDTNLWQLKTNGGICWECKQIIIKFSLFQNQVKLAQSLLGQKGKDLISLSRLVSSTRNHYDCEIDKNTDPLNTLEVLDTKPIEIKQELDNDLKNNIDSDLDEKEINFESNIYVEEQEIKDNNIKKEKVIKKKIKKDKSNKNNVKLGKCKTKEKCIKIEAKPENNEENLEEFKKKFVEVEFTEEEMIKNREEKRSHPNFKKLPYNCDTCVLGFTREETYNLHMAKKHAEHIGPHRCPVCEVRFSSPASLSKHVRKHYHCYRCKLCKYESTELWSALSHCRSKHSRDSEHCIHCPQCDAVVRSREELAAHARAQHALACAECGEKFKGPNTLKTHIRRIHGSQREFKCPMCKKCFSRRSRLESHLAAHGGSHAAGLAYCAPCRVQYKNIYVYRNHLATSASHADTRYHCDVCDKKFASKVYYKRHYAFYHQKTSPFKCELCNRLFISQWRLRAHRQQRHGQPRARTHACVDCGNKFYTGSTLRAHRLTHSAARSFLCADCGDTFRQRPALYTHARLVHNKQTRKQRSAPA